MQRRTITAPAAAHAAMATVGKVTQDCRSIVLHSKRLLAKRRFLTIQFSLRKINLLFLLQFILN